VAIVSVLGRIKHPRDDLETAEDRDAAEMRKLRVRAAREGSSWTEIPEPVVRGRWLVDAATDKLYSPYRGATFCGGKLEFAVDREDLAFFVDRAGDIRVLEPVDRPATWSEYVERQIAATPKKARNEACARQARPDRHG
jgi:hypothetical protein